MSLLSKLFRSSPNSPTLTDIKLAMEDLLKESLSEQQKRHEDELKKEHDRVSQMQLQLDKIKTDKIEGASSKHALPAYLSLPFDQASDPSKFAIQLQGSAIEDYRSNLSKLATPVMQLALKTADIIIKNKQVTVVFKGGIPKGAEFMISKAGHTLPILINGTTKKIISHGKVVTKGTAVGTAALTVAPVLFFEMCHYFSGQEQVKQLKKLGSQMSFIQHSIDAKLHARLESIYRHAKEIIGSFRNGITPEVISELSQLCKELMAIRAEWRHRYHYQLDEITPAKSSSSSKVLRFNKQSSLNKSIEQRTEQFFESSAAIHWMHFALALQMVLSRYTGRLESFVKNTLPDELNDWSKMATKTMESARRITHQKELNEPWKLAIDRIKSTHSLWDSLTQPSENISIEEKTEYTTKELTDTA